MATTVRKPRTVAALAGAAVLVVLALVALNWRTIVARYRFSRLFESIGENEEGRPEFRHRQTGIVMVLVATIGASGDAEPVLLAKHEIDAERWQSMMGRPPELESRITFFERNLPREVLSVRSCREFIEETGLRLPTRRQWESARTGCAFTGEAVTVEYATRRGKSLSQNPIRASAGCEPARLRCASYAILSVVSRASARLAWRALARPRASKRVPG